MTRPKKADPKLAVAYLRISTDRERQPYSGAAQKKDIEGWARDEGVTLVAWFEEEVSGGAELDKRPKLLDALAAVSAHRAGHLVVGKLDRFARNVPVAYAVNLQLAKAGARLTSATEGNGDTAEAELQRGLLLLVAAYERRIIKARIKAAMAVKRDRGHALGAPGRCRYGFKAEGGKLVPHPKEQAIIAEARRLRAAGMSIRDIADELAERRMLNRAGNKFGLEAVAKLVAEPKPEGVR